MCICVSLSAYVTLFCLFSPKISIILLHPDKNVRKLTMNSATYRRPFKPAIPQATASAEGRLGAPATASNSQYNNTGGAQTDIGGSGGHISNATSQINQLGECLTNCLCNPMAFWGSLKPRTWPRRFWNGLVICCSTGELGQLTALELNELEKQLRKLSQEQATGDSPKIILDPAQISTS